MIAAILLTGGVLVSAAPLPKESSFEEPVAVVETAKATETQVEAKNAPEQPKTKPEAPKKVEDPNNCEPERYWAAEPPYECIDKPTQAKSASNVATSSPTASVSGSHQDWMRAAGIPESEWTYVDYIISHESGWRYWVVNSEGSGATGLCQALPGSKMASAGADYLTNPVTQLKWCHGYAIGRYGSWAGAYNYWVANRWW